MAHSHHPNGAIRIPRPMVGIGGSAARKNRFGADGAYRLRTVRRTVFGESYAGDWRNSQPPLGKSLQNVLFPKSAVCHPCGTDLAHFSSTHDFERRRDGFPQPGTIVPMIRADSPRHASCTSDGDETPPNPTGSFESERTRDSAMNLEPPILSQPDSDPVVEPAPEMDTTELDPTQTTPPSTMQPDLAVTTRIPMESGFPPHVPEPPKRRRRR